MKKHNKKLLKAPLDFEAFMHAIRYFEINHMMPGGYTNSDFQLYIIVKGDILRVEDYYDDQEIGRIVEMPLPKTVQQGLDALDHIFAEPWKIEDKQEVLEDYQTEITGISTLEKQQQEYMKALANHIAFKSKPNQL